VVGDRRPDQAPDARPAARGRLGYVDLAQRAAASEPAGRRQAPGRPAQVGLVHGQTTGRERHYRIDEEQLARALAQLHAVSTAWDGRLRRIKRLAEALQKNNNHPTDHEGIDT
jgi:hypothetical protein